MGAEILGFFATLKGQAVLVSLGLWLLGTFGKSTWYQKLREAVGRGAEAAGAAVSALGTSRLKGLWNPIERVICDFVLFAAEQFAVGLRKDNPEKMEEHLVRLEQVGSQTRADAVAVRLAALEEELAPPRDKSDAEVLAQAVAAGEASTAQKLKE